MKFLTLMYQKPRITYQGCHVLHGFQSYFQKIYIFCRLPTEGWSYWSHVLKHRSWNRFFFCQPWYWPHIEPPIAHEHSLTELGAVGTQEGCLASVDIAVVPCLATSLRVGEKPGVRLLVTVEIGVRDDGKDWVVRAWSTWGGDKRGKFTFFFLWKYLLKKQSKFGPAIHFFFFFKLCKSNVEF